MIVSLYYQSNLYITTEHSMRKEYTMSYRNSASFGKRQEFVAIAELLKRGFDVYLTLVDDQQIDCIVRREQIGSDPIYIDIQIKARSNECKPQNAGYFPLLTVNQRPNYFFIFYSEQAACHWIIPSEDLVKIAGQNKTGENTDKYRIRLSSKNHPRPQFNKYKNNFDVLKSYQG